MNEENVKKGIAIMQRAKEHDSVYMPLWQARIGGMCAETEEEMHSCGNRACFAGHIGISKEFRDDGGQIGLNGIPLYKGNPGVGAIQKWLDISELEADAFVHGNCDNVHFSHFYERNWSDVNANDVIAKLELLLSGNLVVEEYVDPDCEEVEDTDE